MVGFEPTVLAPTAFRERHLHPLGPLSARENTRAGHTSHRSLGRRRKRAAESTPERHPNGPGSADGGLEPLPGAPLLDRPRAGEQLLGLGAANATYDLE